MDDDLQQKIEHAQKELMLLQLVGKKINEIREKKSNQIDKEMLESLEEEISAS